MREPILAPVVQPSERTPRLAALPAGQAKTPPPTPEEIKSREKAAAAAEKKEELFVGWEKPLAALVITGDTFGYIEPCGCTGLENQKGGLARRFTLLKELRAKGWEVVPLDVGNQVKRLGRQAEIKFQAMADGMRSMGYQAVGFGADDLRLSFTEMLVGMIGPDSKQDSMFVSANVQLDDARKYKVLQAGGKKIGVTAVVCASHAQRVKSAEFTIVAAADGLKGVVRDLEAQKCDWNVLLSQGTPEEAKALAAAFPLFQVVATTGISGEPTRDPEKLNGGRTALIQTGNKGMYAGVVGLFADRPGAVRYQRVALHSGYEDAPEMMHLLKTYQKQLEKTGLTNLELTPMKHPSGNKFVGTNKCGDCHTKALEVWQKTGHSHATATLEHPPGRSEIPRQFDPECLSCHVTGWNPQQMVPYESGYRSQKDTPKLLDNGCENCHGPGSAHVKAEEDANSKKDLLEKLRLQMRSPLKDAQRQCIECHDLDNSHDFHHEGGFEAYWKKIEHKGKD